MSIRKLFALVLAVALLFAPAFNGAAAAAAAVPDHYAQMNESGHCQAPSPDSGDDEQAPAKSCCISASLGIAVTPTPPLPDDVVKPAPAVFGLSMLHLSYLGEIATPPPRRS